MASGAVFAAAHGRAGACDGEEPDYNRSARIIGGVTAAVGFSLTVGGTFSILAAPRHYRRSRRMSRRRQLGTAFGTVGAIGVAYFLQMIAGIGPFIDCGSS